MENPQLNNQSKPKKPKRTNLLAILILVAVLLGAIIIAGYYYFIPEDRANKNTNQVAVNTNTTADETKDWQTYVNDTFGYSLKYPSDWVVDGADPRNVIIKNTADKTDNFLTIKVESGDPTPGDLGYSEAYERTSVLIGGHNSNKFSCFLYHEEATFYTYYLNSGADRYILSYRGNQTSLVPIYEQIVSTFKFTDETADWQTYTNTVYSYQIKYPKAYEVKDDSRKDIVWINRIATSGSDFTGPGFRILVADKKIEDYEKDLRDEHVDPKPEANLNYVMNDGTPYLEEEVNIGGQKGKKLGFGTAINLNSINYIVEHKGRTYNISTMEVNNFAIFEAMVKTFQFTD